MSFQNASRQQLKFINMHIKNDQIKKDNLIAAGFSEDVRLLELGLCPWCKTPVKIEDFRNEISRKEFNISGVCQKCQDSFFGKD